MKRKIIAALLTAALTVGVFTGCGNRVEGAAGLGRSWRMPGKAETGTLAVWRVEPQNQKMG